jgi:pRiA4b ORF-3-like protein
MSQRKTAGSSARSAAGAAGSELTLADMEQFMTLLRDQVLPPELASTIQHTTRHPARRTPTYYRVRVDLDGAKPPIWRRLNIASELHLGEVHAVLQAAFDWYGGHLHEFSTGRWPDGERFVDDFMVEDGDDGVPEDDVRLDEVLAEPGDKLSYWYDFGDDWRHTITLEAVEPRPDGAPRATVLTGRRAAPPDDCGGIWGYEALLDALADPRHPEHEEMTSWFEEALGRSGNFDPAYLDVEDLDEQVRAVFD